MRVEQLKGDYMKNNQLKKGRLPIYLSLSLILQTTIPCFGWGDGGHMMVAKIAYDRLNPTARAEADRLLAVKIKPISKTLKSLDFIQASHWPDDVRPLPDFAFTAEFHFVDFPFTQDGTPLPSDLPKQENALKALDDYVSTLKTGNDDAEKAEALRFIIHLVGDIHQPLHGSSRVSSRFPEGDRGGNDLHLTERDSQGEKHSVKLHSFWDGGIESFPKMGPNFAPPPVQEVFAAAANVIHNFPDTDAGWDTGDAFAYSVWARESFKIAKEQVYQGLTPGKLVPVSYFERCRPIAERRVAWAGYRLAKLLNTIWPEPVAEQEGHRERGLSVFGATMLRESSENTMTERVAMSAQN